MARVKLRQNRVQSTVPNIQAELHRQMPDENESTDKFDLRCSKKVKDNVPSGVSAPVTIPATPKASMAKQS